MIVPTKTTIQAWPKQQPRTPQGGAEVFTLIVTAMENYSPSLYVLMSGPDCEARRKVLLELENLKYVIRGMETEAARARGG